MANADWWTSQERGHPRSGACASIAVGRADLTVEPSRGAARARGYCGGVIESSADRLFVDPSLTWERVSPALLTERRLVVVGPALVGVVILVWGLLGPQGTGGVVVTTLGAVLLIVSALTWFVLIPNIVSSWRYAEREQDLLVSRGRLFRRLTVVPYGRMQVIEVSANPVSRRLGIATLALVTASAATDARIPGVPADVAQELRDRLAAKGEAAAAGL